MIQETLKEYGIEFDVWFSERHLHANGAIASALELLDKRDISTNKMMRPGSNQPNLVMIKIAWSKSHPVN